MNNNPEGTPNPLNPGPGVANTPREPRREEAMGTGMLDYTESPAPAKPEMPKEEKREVVARPVPPRTNHGVVDPMMRPIAHTEPVRDNFESLEMDSISIEELATDEPVNSVRPAANTTDPVATPFMTRTPQNTNSDFVARDSIVEPAGKKSSKKPFIIGAIIFLIVAIICGAAAVAIIMMGNSSDRVSKAIDKIMNGQGPSIVHIDGNITSVSDGGMPSDTSINFDGTFDLLNSVNKVSADITTTYAGGTGLSIALNEVQTQSGDVFFKLSGLGDIIDMPSDESSAEMVQTNCVDGPEGTNCGSSTAESNPLSVYSGLFEVIDDEWIRVSDNFADSMKGLQLFDNNSTCLINALGTLPEYANNLAAKYKASPFITYSTDKLEISKKKNELYRLGFDQNKMSAFANSLSNSGFINELNACAGNTATNSGISAADIQDIFSRFPSMYVEIDDNDNITRLYFKANIDTGTDSTTTTADLNITYPERIQLQEPASYIEMSTLLNSVMTTLLSTNSENGVTTTE
ncbi:hypothetical protein IKG24_00485 [Candidatus Saccharibacteria bacterium]|nr:hypothetical protein [Candidatus Saccharibacteria bacterium]